MYSGWLVLFWRTYNVSLFSLFTPLKVFFLISFHSRISLFNVILKLNLRIIRILIAEGWAIILLRGIIKQLIDHCIHLRTISAMRSPSVHYLIWWRIITLWYFHGCWHFITLFFRLRCLCFLTSSQNRIPIAQHLQ